jgi:hypothetical protein
MKTAVYDFQEWEGVCAFFFTCWNEAKTSCGVFSCEPKDFRANVNALEKSGYAVHPKKSYDKRNLPLDVLKVLD